MTKADKRIGLSSISARKHEPIVEPHKTPKKVAKRKQKPYVLVVVVPAIFGGRDYRWKHHYASKHARDQAKMNFSGKGTWVGRMKFEEYEE